MEIINTTAVTETQKTKDYFKYRQLRVNKLPSDSFKKTTDPFCQKQPHTDVKANVDKFTLSSSTTSTGVRVPPNKISAQHIYSNRCLGGPSSTGANQTPLLPTQSSQPEPLRNLLTSSTFPVSPTLIQNNFLVASDKKQLIQNTHSNFEAVAANNSVRNSGKDTVMDTTQTATLYVPIIATGTGLTQPVMKYHTIQVPNIKPFGFPSYVTNAPNNNRNCYEEIELSHPKPTCHIAVRQSHDVRRAKFLANPLPKEINILLQENDVICREDLVQRQNLWLSPSSTNTITAGTRKIQSFTMCDDRTLMDGLESDRSGSSNVDKLQSVSMTMWAPTSPTTKIGNISNRKNIFSSFAFLRNTSTQSIENGDVISHKVEPDYISSSISNILPLAYVDHLDDGRRVNNLMISNDSGDETEHYSSCAHGTPSRMPLIRSGSTSNDSKVLSPFVRMSSPSINGFNNAKKTLHFHHSSMNVFPNSSGKFMIQDQKKFQQEGQHQRTQKSIMINSGFKCNRHEERRTSLSPSFCYAGDARSRFNCDNRYNSDDEDDGKELHAFDFLQTNLRRASHFNFCNSPLKPLHFSGKGRIQHHQVPLIIVILILIFYVCLGTMVFALWENWSLIDGAYFCFVTLTTIGCSGLTPEKTLHGPELQLIVCCAYLLLGLVLVAMSFNILETQLMWSCKRLTGRMKLAQD
uniref:Potassium channel domain-containing protein n=1 Tax=Glossina pallidipes TaxID=7398 RepID=A0A1B0A2P4_GLOPL